MSELNEDSEICLDCAGGDLQIARKIVEEGVDATCAICGEMKPTLPVATLADMVEDVFKKYVQWSDPYPWRSEYSTPNEIVQQELLTCDSEDLVDTIVDVCSKREQWAVMKDGEMPLFDDSSSTYELIIPYSEEFNDEWDRFEDGVKHRGRFFLDDEREYLEKIFRPVLDGELHQGKKPIVTLGDEDSEIKAIYRGRAANTAAEQRRILQYPIRELSPPPPTLRIAGRMNAAGVPAFYGATDVDTCVAELAIPIGGAAIVGKFELLEPVHVLDLRLLSRASPRYSYFDPDVERLVNYGRFMRTLRNRLRKPVLGKASSLEYLPTQAVAEFLANEVEGVMFVSSVTPEASEEERFEGSLDSTTEGEADIARTKGINVVLFARAAIVLANLEEPARRIVRVEPPTFFESPFPGWWPVRFVDETPPDDTEPIPYPTFDDALEPTLKLVEDEVVLAVPRSIEYKVNAVKPEFIKADKEPEF